MNSQILQFLHTPEAYSINEVQHIEKNVLIVARLLELYKRIAKNNKIVAKIV